MELSGNIASLKTTRSTKGRSRKVDLGHIAEDLRHLATAIADLNLDPANARIHDERNIDAIVSSLHRFGQRSPIVVQRDGMVVRAGNGRIVAAKRLGWTHIAAVVVDESNLDATSFAIADNRTAELAGWDNDVLARLLDSVRNDDAEAFSATGFNDQEVDELLKEVADGIATEEPLSSEADPSDAMPEKVEAITKPGDVIQLGRHELHCVDCLDMLKDIPENSIDSVVTDPPYGIGFMSKDWDCSVPGEEFARECLRVLKPGGYLISFAATRTVHRLMVALEDAGFEIRDMIAWLQWQGFPKSLDISKAIDKAAGAEREVVGYGPIKKTTSHCMSNSGQNKIGSRKTFYGPPATPDAIKWNGWGTALKPSFEPAILARKPLEGSVAANVLKWGVGGLNVDGCRQAYGDPSWPGPNSETATVKTNTGSPFVCGITKGDDGVIVENTKGRWPANIHHCAKPSRGEKETESSSNHHPTVKPVKLMKWLVRLVTPPAGKIFEPFCGSGSTLLAADTEGFKVIAAEREPEYCDIIRARFQGLNDEI